MYKVGVIGAGKVGVSLGKYFFSNSNSESSSFCDESNLDIPIEGDYGVVGNYKLQGFYSQSYDSAVSAANFTDSESFSSLENLVKRCDILFITTPDDRIQSVWEEISGFFIEDKIICHCSGSLSSKVFFDAEIKKAKVCSMHPLMAISSRETSYLDLQEAFFSIEGNEDAIGVLTGLLDEKGNLYKALNGSDKTKYHVASVFMSNLIIGMYHVASGLLESYGFSEEEALHGFRTLAMGNMENLMKNGEIKSLTGPVERCDIGTITKHLNSLDEERNAREIYRLLSLEILGIAKGKNTNRDYSELENILKIKQR